MVRFRGSYFEVDLGDMRPANSLPWIIGRGGALRLHIQSAKFQIHYMVDSQTLISLTKMRDEILNGNPTTRENTDTWVKSQTFYEPNLNRRIAIRDLGGEEAFNDFMDRLGNMGDLKTRKRKGGKPLRN